MTWRNTQWARLLWNFKNVSIPVSAVREADSHLIEFVLQFDSMFSNIQRPFSTISRFLFW